MTVGFRVIMLPLSIISERNKLRYAMLHKRISSIKHDFGKDPVAMRNRIRLLFEEYRISPWAKTIVLLAQVLLFLILYWVFLRGVNSEQIGTILYDFVGHPGIINTDFYGFNIAARSALWAGATGILFFLIVLIEQHGQRLKRADLYYRVLFPFSIFIFLWLLPMVKSLFFMTSVLFSLVLILLRKLFIKTPKSR